MPQNKSKDYWSIPYRSPGSKPGKKHFILHERVREGLADGVIFFKVAQKYKLKTLHTRHITFSYLLTVNILNFVYIVSVYV